MTFDLSSLRFVVKAKLNKGARPRELSHTMVPHPLSYQELPYDPEYTLYNNRLTPESLSHVTEDQMYWKIRTEVIFRHTGELPIEISGPDAESLLSHVFTRDVSKVKVGRCSYQFACYHDGGMITDGVLLRLAQDRFWMVQADGDMFSWYKAHAHGLDVTISDPKVWVSQVQGPRSIEVLKSVAGSLPDPFRYFDLSEVTIAGQKAIISRTGFSNELGWEIYLMPDTDIAAIGDHILEVGKTFGMTLTAAPVFRSRRIEAGLLNAGSDFDETTTPFEVGLGHLVEFDHRDFVGREALERSERQCRTWGMRVSGGIANLGRIIKVNEQVAGRVCSSGWSPYQGCGVAIARMDKSSLGPGTQVQVEGIDGSVLEGELCTLPMYDKKRLIPRGKLVDIPTQPILMKYPIHTISSSN